MKGEKRLINIMFYYLFAPLLTQIPISATASNHIFIPKFCIDLNIVCILPAYSQPIHRKKKINKRTFLSLPS